jgi:hypothetical protein
MRTDFGSRPARRPADYLAQMRDLCAAQGCTLVLASNGYWTFQQVDRNQDWLMRSMPAIAAELGVPYLECAPFLRFATEDASSLELPTDPHPSSKGIEKLARCFK